MAGILKINSIQLGDSAIATQNFTLRTNIDGTATLARGNVGATTQDILTIDAAGVASLLGKLVFSRGNVLGPVSQVGGVPTGAVIEVITNGNGMATRWADGTQICTGALADIALIANGYGGAGAPASFPAAFVNAAPIVSYRCAPSLSGDFYGFIYDVVPYSLTSHQPLFRNGATAQSVISIRWVAVGRWF